MKKQKVQSRKKIIKELRKRGVVIEGDGATISPEATVESGARICSPCHICGSTHICAGAEVSAYSYIENSHIGKNARVLSSRVCDSRVGEGATVGPFAYLRQNADVGEGCRVGDFVEIKNSRLGEGCKVAHLAYVGDARLGKRVNVGCGVVFANYDGREKHYSSVDDDCFIGCNSNIVAPVHIAKGAYIAAGSTVTVSLEEYDLCIARSRERIFPQGGEDRYLARREEKTQ